MSKTLQHEPEFMQAVREVAENVIPYIVQHDIYHGKNILMRMAEPERVVSFRVPWLMILEKSSQSWFSDRR